MLSFQVAVKNTRDLRVRMTIRRIHGPKNLVTEIEDVVVLCLFRDGQSYLTQFLAHHRKLGVKHFVFIDNGSTDQSNEIITAQKDTTLYTSKLPFGKYKWCFKRFLAKKYATRSWVLLLDIDEFFDFPKSDQVSLAQLICYLESKQCNAVVAQMLDLFSNRPLLDLPEEEENLSADYKYYDLTHVIEEEYSIMFGQTNRITDDRIRTLIGGVRNRFFGKDDYLLLTKHPLFRLKPGTGCPNNGHEITHATIADFTVVLYHYKFNREFSKVLLRALEEKGYYGESIFYKTIQQKLTENPKLNLYTADSKKLESPDELVEAGFLHTGKQFLEWISQINEKNGR